MNSTEVPYEHNLVVFDVHAHDFPIKPAAPDLPLGYVMEIVTINCDCGRTFEHSRLLVIERSSSKGRRMTPLGRSQQIYDLPITVHNSIGGTPACVHCLDSVIKLPAPEMDNSRSFKKPSEPSTKLSLDDLGDLL